MFYEEVDFYNKPIDRNFSINTEQKAVYVFHFLVLKTLF